MPGYSLVAAASLLLAGTAAGFALRSVDVPWYVTALVIVLCFVRPLLLCQFTINAGLLAASSVLCALAYTRAGRGAALLGLTVLLMFLGVLVRLEQAAVVACVGAAFIPWRMMLCSRSLLLSGLAIGLLVSVAVVIDHRALSTEEWDDFWAFRSVQAPITDYRAGVRLQQSPDVLAESGLTVEEVRLLLRWGFLSKDLTNPERLQGALDALGPSLHPDGALAGAWAGIAALFRPTLIWLSSAAIIACAVLRSRAVLLGWVVFLIVIGALGAIGRPGVERVYMPVYLLLIGGAFLACARLSRGHLIAVTAALGLSALAYVPGLFERAGPNRATFAQHGRALEALGNQDVVAWGWWIYFERAYPAWGTIPKVQARLLGLNAYTYAPYSVAARDVSSGRGPIDRLRSAEGMLVVCTPEDERLLRTHLKSRYGWELRSETAGQFPLFQLSRMRVVP